MTATIKTRYSEWFGVSMITAYDQDGQILRSSRKTNEPVIRAELVAQGYTIVDGEI